MVQHDGENTSHDELRRTFQIQQRRNAVLLEGEGDVGMAGDFHPTKPLLHQEDGGTPRTRRKEGKGPTTPFKP